VKLKTPPAQQIMESQGYLILSSISPRQVGDIIPHARGGYGYRDIPGPMVVVGPATREEWERQHLAIGSEPNPRRDSRGRESYPFYLKVIAE
jgi:hypothetical protein